MGHLYHGYVSHNQRVISSVIDSYRIRTSGSFQNWRPHFFFFPEKNVTNTHSSDSRIRHRNSPCFMMNKNESILINDHDS